MRAIVYVYDNKEDYVLGEKYPKNPRFIAYEEEYYSITEAIEELKRTVSAVRKGNRDNDTHAFIGFRLYDNLGDLRWELPSESVTQADKDFFEAKRVREHFIEKRRRAEEDSPAQKIG